MALGSFRNLGPFFETERQTHILEPKMGLCRGHLHISLVPLPPGVPPRHVLPQPPPPPSKSPSAQPPQDPLVPSKGQTQQEREFILPSPSGVASSAPLGATASETGTQFADYESVVEAAKAAMESASRDL